MTKICVVTDFEMRPADWTWVPAPFREWLAAAARRHVFAGLDPEALSDIDVVKTRPGLITPHVAMALKNGETIKYWSGLETPQIKRVVEWIAEIEQRDPRVARAIPRMSFAQALEHSERWHEQMRRQSERMAEEARRIKSEAGTPTVLTLDGEWTGWRWVWLKTNEARDDEFDAMRHCVGDGSYDHPDENEGVFSLRDRHNAPHVTMDLVGMEVEQAQGRGNIDVADRYQPLVDQAAKIIGLRLWINEDPTKEIADGVHKVSGSEYHVRNNILHRTDGPAVIYPNGITEGWVDGVTTIYGYPSIAHNWLQEFLKDGKRHRDGGPAVIADGVLEWYRDGELLRTEFENTADAVIGAVYSFGYLGASNLARVTSGHDDDCNPVPLIEGLNYIVDGPARTFMLKSMPDAAVPGPLVIVTERVGKRDMVRELAEAKAASLTAQRGSLFGDAAGVIVGGIERDQTDTPAAYWMFQRRPQDMIESDGLAAAAVREPSNNLLGEAWQPSHHYEAGDLVHMNGVRFIARNSHLGSADLDLNHQPAQMLATAWHPLEMSLATVPAAAPRAAAVHESLPDSPSAEETDAADSRRHELRRS